MTGDVDREVWRCAYCGEQVGTDDGPPTGDCETCGNRDWRALVTDGGHSPPQATFDGDERTPPTCIPPHEECENDVKRVIDVYYGGPAMVTITWGVCRQHAQDVRETGDVQADRAYRESQDGYQHPGGTDR